MEFGEKLKKELYYFDESIYLTNHGSYGAVPIPIEQKRHALQIEMEKNPDIWFRYTSFELWNKNRQCLADYLRVKSDNLVLVENASDGTNSVLRSIDFKDSNDAILAQEYTYGAALNAIDYISKYRFTENNHVQLFKVPCHYLISSVQSILDQYEELCREIIEIKKLNLKLVIIDHISSASATLFPVGNIIAIIRKWENIQNKKIKILVDGAHAIGQIDIKLNELDCDYYVSNLHKWFLAPRGCAFLYFRDINETYSLNPNVISHGYKKEAKRNFFERATRDSTSWFVVVDCINMYEYKFGGMKAIQEYTSKLLDEAVKMLTTAWGTKSLEMPKELEAPYMRIVHLPYLEEFMQPDKIDINIALLKLVDTLHSNYKVDSQIPIINNQLCCRISAFVYSRMEDYIALRDAILDLASKVIKHE